MKFVYPWFSLLTLLNSTYYCNDIHFVYDFCINLFNILTLAISLYTKRTIVTMITMVIVIFSVESIKIPFIENFSLRQIVNNFTNSFSTYDPILFGPNLLSRPLYLLISLLFITIISLIVILFKGKRQQI